MFKSVLLWVRSLTPNSKTRIVNKRCQFEFEYKHRPLRLSAKYSSLVRSSSEFSLCSVSDESIQPLRRVVSEGDFSMLKGKG